MADDDQPMFTAKKVHGKWRIAHRTGEITLLLPARYKSERQAARVAERLTLAMVAGDQPDGPFVVRMVDDEAEYDVDTMYDVILHPPGATNSPDQTHLIYRGPCKDRCEDLARRMNETLENFLDASPEDDDEG